MRRGERGGERVRKVRGATAAVEIGSRVFPLRGPPGPMPSVGTRRSTRVFVPKAVAKPGGSARSLRSGKRLAISENPGKKPNRDADEWLGVFGNNGGAAGLRWWRADEEAEDFGAAHSISIDTDADSGDQMSESTSLEALDGIQGRKLFGIVYSRKRRRSRSGEKDSIDKKYGIVFTRKQRKKKLKLASLSEEILERREIDVDKLDVLSSGSVATDWELRIEDSAKVYAKKVGIVEGDIRFHLCGPVTLAILIDSSGSGSSQFATFFILVLKWLGRAGSRFQELVSFLFSQSIAGVFSHHGIHFLPLQRSKAEVFPRKNASCGLCLINGAVEFVPLVSLDFSALPNYFKSMHLRIALGSLYLPGCLIRYLVALYGEAPIVGRFEDYDSHIPMETDCFGNGLGVGDFNSVKKDMQSSAFKLMPMAGRNAIIVHGLRLRNHQRKRSSLRHSRIWSPSRLELRGSALNPDQNGLHVKPHETSSDVLSAKEGFDVPNVYGSSKKLSKSVKKSTADRIKEIRMRAALAHVKENIDSERCNVNILVTVADRCWREEGAEVMLELSETNNWCLAVRSQGVERYLHKPHELRPPVVNRFTHGYMWSGEEGWKLEFPDRWDWLVFKELHMECQQRNALDVPLKSIPVPVVQEVPSYDDDTPASFSRSDSYILMIADEVERAMTSEVPYYDMDSGDEEWLEQLNDSSANDDFNCLSNDNFEKMIFALEKEAYCHPDDHFDLDKALNICQDLGDRDLVAAVFDYWSRKKKQKCAALVKVFQGQPVRRPRLLQQPFFRKKRSFKRQRSQDGRGRIDYFFEDGAKQEAFRRVLDAEAAARRAVESAIRLRSRAQLFMANAELASYKSVMALRLAEAISASESPDLCLLHSPMNEPTP